MSPDEILDIMHVLKQANLLLDFKGQGTCLQILIDSLKLSSNSCFDQIINKSEEDSAEFAQILESLISANSPQ